MGGFECLKLEFADLDDTVLYLGDACPIIVNKNDEGSEDYGKYKLVICSNGHTFVMGYKEKNKRDTDYEYVLEQLDWLMRPFGMNKEDE